MVAKRRSGAAKKPPDTPGRSEPVPLFKEVVDSQMDVWKKWSRKAGADVSDAAREVAPIVAQHWAKMFAAIWNSALEARTRESSLTAQDDMRRQMLVSYNEMMKKVLATKSFASRSGNAVRGMLDGVKAWNEVMEETLKALHLPSKGDIDELHETLYDLGKRVDYLTKAMQSCGTRRSSA